MGHDASDTLREPVNHLQTIAPGFVGAPSITALITAQAGSLLVAATYWHVQGNTVTVTDTMGLAWTALPAVDNKCSFTDTRTTGAQIWYAQVDTAGSTIVTLSQSNSPNAPLGMRLLEYTGVAGYNASVGSPPIVATSMDMSTGAFATTEPAMTVALFVDTLGSGTMTPGAGWNERAIELPFYSLVEDNAPGKPPGPLEPNASLPVGRVDDCWVGTAAAFTSL